MNTSRWCSAVMAALLATAPWVPAAAQATMQSMQPETSSVPQEQPGTGAKVGAAVLNVVYVPGKAIVCGAGTIVAGAFMLFTFGSAYREAVSFFNEGCSGPWTLTPEQVAAAPKKATLEY